MTTPARRVARPKRRADVSAPAPVEDARRQDATRVLQQFRVVLNAVKAHFQQVERRVGVGGAQVWAMAVISKQPGIGVNDLAHALSVRQPTASNIVKSLSQNALVEVRRQAADRRKVQLHLLPPAREILRRAPGPSAGVLPEALASLDSRTLQRLEADLSRLIRVLGADRGAGHIPLAQI